MMQKMQEHDAETTLYSSGCQPEFPISTLPLRENHTPAALSRQVQIDIAALGSHGGSFGSFADLFRLFLASNPRQCRSQRGLTLQPQPIFASALRPREIPSARAVVDRDNRIGEDFPAPD